MEKLGYHDLAPNETDDDDPKAKVIDIARARAQRAIREFLEFQGRILSGEIPLHKSQRLKIKNR